MQIIALDHIQLAMPAGEEDAAREFYVNVLGFHEVTKPEPLVNRGGCWFARDGIDVHLGVMADFAPATKAHPAFRVADLAQAKQTFSAANVTIKPDNSLPHVRRFYVNDPFGNRIEILQDGDVY